MDFFNPNNYRYFWKSKPSEQIGYNKCYYMDTPDGDHIEVDFNFPRQMVQISIKIAEEHGKEYRSVLKSGTIIQERDVTRKRAVDLTSRFRPFGKFFENLRDEMLLQTIGGNYSFPAKPAVISDRSDRDGIVPFLRARPTGILERIRHYLERKREQESLERPFWKRALRRVPDELFDLSIGVIPVIAFSLGYLKAAEMATLTGFYALACGAFDWVWRQRNPFLPKVILFLAISAFSVYTEIQNRVWGIFL